MTGNTYRMGETVCIEAELEGISTSISEVKIGIISTTTGAEVVEETQMEEIGNQKYRYFFDTRLGYSEMSGYSGISAYNTASGIVYSGYTVTSGYSSAISGLYTATITGRDSQDHIGTESFKIRIA
jgi:hypothetical protein